MTCIDSPDLTPDEEQAHIEYCRSLGPQGRPFEARRLSEELIAASRAELRRQRPGVSEQDVLAEWIEIHYGIRIPPEFRARLGKKSS